MSVLNQSKVLVLNKTTHPIGVVGLERAMCLVTSTYSNDEPKAVILDPFMEFRYFTWSEWSKLIPSDNEPVIRSPKSIFRAPEIIRLTRFNKLPQQKLQFSRRTIYKRDGNQCKYCGDKPGSENLSIDHITPRAVGGLTTWTNCCLACLECNRAKADIVPKRFVMIENKNNRKVAVTYYTITFSSGKKTWQVTIKEPERPKVNYYKTEYKCKSWEAVLGEAYWLVELDNDMKNV